MKRHRFILAVCFFVCYGLFWIGQANAQQTKAQCRSSYNAQMGRIAAHYDPLMNAQKVKIAELKNKVATYERKGKISVAQKAIINTWNKQMNLAAQEHARLRQERLRKENAAQASLTACEKKAKK